MNSSKIKAILVNYNFTPTWLFDYNFDYHIFDRSDSKEYLKDFPKERITRTENIGNVDRDKLRWLYDNYDNLPESFLWGKTNLFKYISREEFDSLPDDKFTPLLTQNHKTYSDEKGVVNFYRDGMYWERNDSWYLNQFPTNYKSWWEWSKFMGLPRPLYIPFPPGGNFILTKERVQRYDKRLYLDMYCAVSHTILPGEAQLCERSYYLLWQ